MILDGKKIALARKIKLKKEIEVLIQKNQRQPSLKVLMVGNDPASETYVAHKLKVANELNIKAELIRFDFDVKHAELYSKIDELNVDENVDGILLQLPLPKSFNEEDYLQAISPSKDVDGFHYINQGRLLQGYETIYPCTPLGIINLLEDYNIKLTGQNVTVIGTSNIVGKPLALMLLNKKATVTMCNKNTIDIKKHTKSADILISATGKKFIITEDMVNSNCTVIDVGIIRDLTTNKLVGDVDFENVAKKVKNITPVPGGVGPMTVITLMENTLKLYKNK
ncbi:bifunctional 5,10-methylenetetrahydrofolate dehydrogenase/5,10-methenyltetrahydrofolate cyclohydrolase [Mesoplasma corruscae]|uniref:Bifunctional protein FolD n=1 Tax=Mesoplasma corruscae TaxID=216874 RepID=A0A2S5RGP1_9MOLU|nr:bifunctional 5,10-methylenetetrahydrofolate dehydrogenase/5,10-methenyltetrahydrofolate cyclohydrolase [Mesoplasma corruscae]PPE06504.1 methylenetetrahydrofolate dehydrogenase/methylenetetrahydrofolate cyclohydrolase [Mesoplasma corruscae]